MALFAVDWVVISSLATAAGTLVLAVATFSAVRSSSRSARIAEAALQEQRRPLLAPSRHGRPPTENHVHGGQLGCCPRRTRRGRVHRRHGVSGPQPAEHRQWNSGLPGLGGHTGYLDE